MNFLKQLEAWATDLQHRFTSDLFFRTTLYVVAIQVALVLVLVALFAIALRYANEAVVQTTIAHVVNILETNSSASPDALVRQVGNIQTGFTVVVIMIVVGLAVVSGLSLAYLTLRPSRESLVNQKLFMSNVAHELRTPLSTIKTSTEVLLLDQHLTPDMRRTLKEVVEELDRASEIINNLLSLNSLLRPERIVFTSVDLGTVVEASVRRLSPLAQRRNISITLKKTDAPMVWGNASALEQVVTNIVRNSLSYMANRKGGTVEISIAPDYRGFVMFSVSDNGIGIAQQDLFHIFEPFYRADLSRARNSQVQNRGSGLGLAIVNEIIRVHHGKIRMKSALGKGTTATVLLPTGHDMRAMSEHRFEHQDGVNEMSVDFSRMRNALPYYDQSPNKNDAV